MPHVKGWADWVIRAVPEVEEARHGVFFTFAAVFGRAEIYTKSAEKQNRIGNSVLQLFLSDHYLT